MIKILLNENLRTFEADIRDLVMAFFSYQEFIFIYDNEQKNTNYSEKNVSEKINNCEVSIDLSKIKLISGDRKTVRNQLKRDVYNLLQNITNKKLLWGTLTGIRPVNIITESKMNNNEIKLYLQNEYFVSNEKIKLLLNTAKVEKEILLRKENTNYKNTYSVYVGVPFCKSTCLYCSFTSYNIDKYKEVADKYLDALENEFKKEYNNFPKNKKLHSVYVGGGTPTSLSEKQFERFLGIINKYIFQNKNIIKNSNKIEYTIEAGRPDTITEEKLKCMKKYNVTRISINPQTFNQKTLDLIGRKHTVKEVINKYKLARKLGFNNINMDLIIGLPNEKLNDVLKSLLQTIKLKPDSLTVHSLALKRASRLNVEKDSWVKNLSGLKDDQTEINNMMQICNFTAEKLKLRPYYLYRQKNIAGNLENVGFAKKNKECVYNILMMGEKHSVFAFGCNAATKIVTYKQNEKLVQRIEGHKSVLDYIKKWEEK